MVRFIKIIIGLCFFIFNWNTSYSQGKIKAGDIFLNFKAGVTAGYLFGEEEHYTYPQYGQPYYDEQIRISFLAGITFIQMITEKLFYSAGIQYHSRKMRLIYHPIPKHVIYPYMDDPVVDEFKKFYYLEYPLMIGLVFNRINVQGGFQAAVLRHIQTEVHSRSGNLYGYYGSTQYKINIFPAITASYKLSEKHNIFLFAGLEKQLLVPWYFANAGLSVTFGLQEEKGSYYKYCKPPG